MEYQSLWELVLVCVGVAVKRRMYQREVDVDMLNAVKSLLADVSSIRPSSGQGETREKTRDSWSIWTFYAGLTLMKLQRFLLLRVFQPDWVLIFLHDQRPWNPKGIIALVKSAIVVKVPAQLSLMFFRLNCLWPTITQH